LEKLNSFATKKWLIKVFILLLRSFVAEPMRYQSLFIAGNAAHIVPPTRAKDLNLAASDVWYMAEAFTEVYSNGSNAGFEHYSDRALTRVWIAIRFSSWFIHLTHCFPHGGPDSLEHKLQITELNYIVNSEDASKSLAENYIGLPI